MTQLLRGNTPDTDSDDTGGRARDAEVAADQPRESAPSRPARAAALTVVIGLLLTGASAWTAYRIDRDAEEGLHRTQTEQAGAVLSTAVAVIQQPLTTALQVQAISGPDGDPSVFRRAFAANVGEDALFVSASLWHSDGESFNRLVAVGAPPGMDPGGPEVQEILTRALESKTSVVQKITVGNGERIVYTLADPSTGFIVKVERAIPADRRSTVDDNEVFAHLDYAIYFGEETDRSELTTTSVDPATLPLDDPTASTEVTFGDTVLTLVTRPKDHLGSRLSQWLPLILLVGGLLLTLATALVARQLIRAQIHVEEDAATINQLYQRINGLYEDQRALFLRLQRALLPHVIPDIPQLAVASKYVAGTEGVEVGGDWYSIIDIGEDQFGFVVGDVSGRGVDAVAEMARARFTLRAYLVDGNTPAQALEKCSGQFDITVDQHIITVIVGLGTWSTGEVVVANAGHPLPLLLSSEGSEYVSMPVGPPLGVGTSSYDSATFTIPVGSTLIAYTDGLVERRDEDIDVGMRRLADTAERHRDEDVSDLLTSVLTALRGNDAADDTAMLALRRLPARS